MVTERSTYMRPTADRQHRWGPAHTSSYLDRSDDTFQGETMPRCTGWCTSQVPDLAISKKQVCVSKRVHHLRPLLDFKHNCWQHSVPHRTTLWGGTVSFPTTTTTTTTTALDTNLGGATRGGGLYWCHSGLDLRVLPSKLLSQHTRCWRCMPRRGSHVTLVRRNPPRASETPCTGPLIPASDPLMIASHCWHGFHLLPKDTHLKTLKKVGMGRRVGSPVDWVGSVRRCRNCQRWWVNHRWSTRQRLIYGFLGHQRGHPIALNIPQNIQNYRGLEKKQNVD